MGTAKPCFRAFRLEWLLPAAVRGPELRCGIMLTFRLKISIGSRQIFEFAIDNVGRRRSQVSAKFCSPPRDLVQDRVASALGRLKEFFEQVQLPDFLHKRISVNALVIACLVGKVGTAPPFFNALLYRFLCFPSLFFSYPVRSLIKANFGHDLLRANRSWF